MPKHPLLPLLRLGGVLALGVFLLWPRAVRRGFHPSVAGGFIVDVRADSAPPPPGGHIVPGTPFPGQVVPDARGRCTDPDDVVLSGGCWAKMAKQPHPTTGCGRYYRSGDACYAPVMKAPRMPTSIEE